MITGRVDGMTSNTFSNGPVEAFYIPFGCTPTVAGKWAVHFVTGASLTNTTTYNVLVFKP